MRLIDTVKLAATTPDAYGDRTVTELVEVKSLFMQRTALDHVNNADGITSDAAVYLDPTNPKVMEKLFHLEGMYIIAQPFGQAAGDAWYRISRVNVGQRKLLNNAIDNIYCRLEKVAGMPYAMVS